MVYTSYNAKESSLCLKLKFSMFLQPDGVSFDSLNFDYLI